MNNLSVVAKRMHNMRQKAKLNIGMSVSTKISKVRNYERSTISTINSVAAVANNNAYCGNSLFLFVLAEGEFILFSSLYIQAHYFLTISYIIK